ncbi:hypothetical protein OG723_33855 [Streptomyces sp. NBC_01278]|uniref:hypothetical protein n=1 Tax=Streptomyces sp. NBC_01278 TaxID=2903809 RepID=UPI002E3407AB|nr:hypothetical protein [Streptomyces sp. NBC_01278]
MTDLPLRQVYYWGVEGERTGAGPEPPCPAAATRPPRPTDAAAPGTLVDEAQRQLR